LTSEKQWIQVATNVETTKQAQPADFTCLAYHALKAKIEIRGRRWEYHADIMQISWDI
jgi:hypothetical protein